METTSGNLASALKIEPGITAIIGSGGSGVSGGQRQRMAIARAMMKKTEFMCLTIVFLL